MNAPCLFSWWVENQPEGQLLNAPFLFSRWGVNEPVGQQRIQLIQGVDGKGDTLRLYFSLYASWEVAANERGGCLSRSLPSFVSSPCLRCSVKDDNGGGE
jgi:hypothetical protein